MRLSHRLMVLLMSSGSIRCKFQALAYANTVELHDVWHCDGPIASRTFIHSSNVPCSSWSASKCFVAGSRPVLKTQRVEPSLTLIDSRNAAFRLVDVTKAPLPSLHPH